MRGGCCCCCFGISRLDLDFCDTSRTYTPAHFHSIMTTRWKCPANVPDMHTIQRNGECGAKKGQEADYFCFDLFHRHLMVQVTAYGSVPSVARPLAPLAKRTGAVRFIAVATLALGAFAAVIMVGQTRPGTLHFSKSCIGHRNVHFRMLMYLWCWWVCGCGVSVCVSGS